MSRQGFMMADARDSRMPGCPGEARPKKPSRWCQGARDPAHCDQCLGFV